MSQSRNLRLNRYTPRTCKSIDIQRLPDSSGSVPFIERRWETFETSTLIYVVCCPKSLTDLDIRRFLQSMQLEGSCKRKRRSSASNGDIENSPVCEVKRAREDDHPGYLGDGDQLATEERLPLTELPVSQTLDDSDSSEADWLDACNEELSFGDDEGDIEHLDGSEVEDSTSVDENEVPPHKIRRIVDNFKQNSPSPLSSSFERLEACNEDLSIGDEEDDRGNLDGSQVEDTTSVDDNEEQPHKIRLEACNEDISMEVDDAENTDECEVEDAPSTEENEEPPQKIMRTSDNYFEQNSFPPRLTSFERNFFQAKRHFATIPELMNFFKRKLRCGAEDRNKIFCGNPGLQPKMRSVLLEWIVEVCDVYKLHRETYHLTVDYLDRYLCLSENISKGQLQLIGVTALLIAAKYEEIYPPKISDFAYITDGACTDQDIIKMENLMVQVLEWRCTVTTSNAWVLGLLQLLGMLEKEEPKSQDVSVPQYNHTIYETIMHLLDLCSLDCGFVKFSYKVLALSSIHVVVSKPNPVILKVSGYELDDLANCIEWLQPFWATLCQKFNYEAITVTTIGNNGASGKAVDFSHMRIKHNIDLDMLEAVQMIFEAKEKNEVISELLLTPPLSSEKRRGKHNRGIKLETSGGN